jgi:peptidoglycan/xylan/chitin deacetylase (PgdA/CDA1 family)
MPFDRWGTRVRSRTPAEAWRAMDWEQLERCAASGLITIGAHSHLHLNASECTPSQLHQEAEASRAVLASRLGEAHAATYAYPYGCTRLGEVSAEYVRAVQAAGYRLAVSTDLGLARAESDRYRLPRIEVHALDSPAVVRAKARGALAPYYVTDRLRSARRVG